MLEIGLNLKRIRLLKNLSLKKAGELLNMSAPAILKYERGEIIPDSTKIIAFANAYKVKTSDILKVSPKITMQFTNFRKKKILKGQKLELLKSIILEKVSNYLEVLDLGQINSKKLVIKRYNVHNLDEAEIAAEKFRQENHLSLNQPLTDLINILENIGIIIITLENQNNLFTGFDGLSEIVNGIPVIVYLENSHDGARQRFTIAHELGHLLLKITDDLDCEKVCNRFASSLLMPKLAIYSEFGKLRHNISNYELKAFKMEYKVSMYAIVYRLKELNVISDYLFKNINIYFNKSGYRQEEPNPLEPEKSYQYKKIVHKLEINGIITISKACEFLNQTIDEYNNEDNNYRYKYSN